MQLISTLIVAALQHHVFEQFLAQASAARVWLSTSAARAMVPSAKAITAATRVAALSSAEGSAAVETSVAAGGVTVGEFNPAGVSEVGKSVAVGTATVGLVDPAADGKAVAARAAAVADSNVATAADSKVCLAAADVLKRFGKGKQRIPLEQLGISPLNRAISGKHVHTLGRRILSVEGFCVFRYRAGICHEWDPENALAVAHYTNRQARRDPLLAPVPEVPLFGSFAKSHLLSFLQALKSKSVRWSDSGDLMVPDEGQAALMDHLRHGMFYEVLDYRAIKEEREAVVGLIAADNFDAGFALGQTEIQLLRVISDTMQVHVRPAIGFSQFDVVRDAVERSAGQRWSPSDLAGMFNLCKVIGDVHLEFLHDFVLGFVDQDVMAVKTTCFAAAAKIAPQAPWVKIALLCTQYMSQDSHLEKAGGKTYGVQVSKKQWDKFQRFSGDELLKLELFLSAVFAKYRSLSGTSEEALGRELPGFFVRVGKRMLLADDLSVVEADFDKLENKLREQLPCSNLPPPVCDLQKPPAAGAAENADKKRKADAIVPDDRPALAFAGDSVVVDMHCEARALGFTKGCGVRCTRHVQGVKKDTEGVINAFAEDAIFVRWNDTEQDVRMQLADIAMLDSQTAARAAEASKKGKGVAGNDAGDNASNTAKGVVGADAAEGIGAATASKKAKGVAGTDAAGATGSPAAGGATGRPAVEVAGSPAAGGIPAAGASEKSAGDADDGIAWREGKAEDANIALTWLAGNALHDICKIYGSGHDLLRITWEKSPQFFAKCDIPARTLIILPSPQRFQCDAPKNFVNVVTIKGELMRENVAFYVLEPTDANPAAGAAGKTWKCGDAGMVESEAGPVRALYLYWVALGLQTARAVKGSVALVHDVMNIDVPLASAIPRRPQMKSKKPAATLNLNVPYITNDCDISAGTRLVVKRLAHGTS